MQATFLSTFAAMSTELRVFISSTFRDLQNERDYLIKKVFPDLRALCRERGITLTEIDLRWGLTEEESLYGNIIRRCLEEVDRCRPWFICIVGSRYGYVPTITDIHKDPQLLQQFPWIEEAVMDEMSIMEMEVRHGAIGIAPESASNGGMANPHARFYFRQASNGHDPVPAKNPAEAARVAALKQSVVDAGANVRGFRSASELGRMVHDDLLALIQEWSPLALDTTTPLQRERRRHESFAISRRQAYIPRPETLSKLNHLAEQARRNAALANSTPASLTSSKPNGMVVAAASGNGKSALIAYWAEQYRRRHPEVFVVEHYVGIGTEQNQQMEVVRHLMMEIRERGLANDPIPTTADELYQALPHWLAAVHNQPMVILLDGLNHLGKQGLAWFPTHLPPSVAMVTTTTDPSTADLLVEQGWSHMEIEPLRPDERQAVIVRFLGESYKALNTGQLQRIGAEPHCAHPLFLRTFLEELRVFGHHDRLDQQIDWYLSAHDTHDLFQRMLQRMEQDFGERMVRNMMVLLWGARNGLSEPEIASMTHGARLQLASLIASLDYHLINRDGLLTFFHDYLRTAVERRYLPTVAKQRAVHRRLARYFASHPIGTRRLQEEPWQWRKADDANQLHALLTDLSIFGMLWHQQKFHLLEYWRFLETTISPVEAYRAAAARLQPDQAIMVLHQLAAFFLAMGRRSDAEEFARESVRLARLHQHPELQKALLALGEILRQSNQFAEAEAVAREALQMPNHPDTPPHTQGLDLLSNILLDSGAFDQAEQLLRAAIENVSTLTTQQDLNLYGNLGLLFHYRGRLQEAAQIQRKLLELHTRIGGDDTPDTADTHHNLGRVLFDMGRLEEALSEFQCAAAIWQRAFGPHHSLSLLAQSGIADVMLRQGNYQEAMDSYRVLLAMRQRLFGNRHLHTVQSGLSLSLALRFMNKHQESETLYRQLLQTLREIVEPQHHFIIHAMHNLANVLLLQKKYAEAVEMLEEVLNIRIAQHGEQHGDVVATLLILSEARMQEGRAEEAKAVTERAVHISQQVLGTNHQRTAMAVRRLGVIMQTLGDVAAAERHLRHAIQIYETSVGTNHPDTEETRELLQQVQQPGRRPVATER